MLLNGASTLFMFTIQLSLHKNASIFKLLEGLKNRGAKLVVEQNVSSLKDTRKTGNFAHQVNFGIFFYNFHVFFWIVAIPPIPLPIIVKHQLRLDMFVWSYVSSCKFCSNSPRSLENRGRLHLSLSTCSPEENFL